MAQAPAVTVVIPCFNQAQFLGAAIESVRRQTLQPIELIVVDDGSTDDTQQLARNAGAAVIAQANAGLSEARNAGLRAAAGDLIIMLDADDELLPEAAAVGAAALGSDLEALAVVGRCEVTDASGRVLPARYHEIDGSNLYREWLSRNFVWTPGAAMFRRDALVRIGAFPPGLGPVADYAVYLRLARAGRILLHSRPVVRYRQHDTSMSRDPIMMLRLTLDVLRRERCEAPRPLLAEIRRGERAWRAWYGERILRQLRMDWHGGRRGAARARAVLALLRYAPRLLVVHAARQLKTLAARTRRRLPAAETEGGTTP